jgi:hypothetical protein
VTFELRHHDLDHHDPALVLRGHVVDEQGRPVANAVVEPFGFGKGDGAQFGGLKGFDSLALTNAEGEFRLGVPEPGLLVYVRVSAAFRAPQAFKRLPAGPKPNELTHFTGATVTGRLVKNGKPLAGVAVGLVQRDRSADSSFVGEFQIATDIGGRFRIPNVPPQDVFVLYGKMSSLRTHGAVGVQTVQTGASGSEVYVGVLDVMPGLRLSGQVVLADGRPVPAGTRVLLSRTEAWDTQHAEVDEKGNFSFTDLPAEGYSLSVNVRGYHVSPKNASFELLNQFMLAGVVQSDTTGLRLLLEPGPQPQRPAFDQALLKEYQRRKEAPLRGAPEEPTTK